jgi:two-component system alkaline phosphatase synthesis response regulator PhoP
MSHILAVDDEPLVLQTIHLILEDVGYSVSMAASGREALDLVTSQRPDLIILDIIMPEIDGIEVCRRIRADPFTSKLPVMFLTAKGRPADVARGLDAGGDDYLIKPFEVIELPARVRALLRRAPSKSLDTEAEYLVAGDLKIHEKHLEAWIGDRQVKLTIVEHQLLHYLMLHAGQPVAVDHLLRDVWGYEAGTGNPKLVQVHIARLRAKIEQQSDRPQYIRNVRGRGYLIDS